MDGKVAEKNRILIVEDESIISRDLSQRLTLMGYEVARIVTSGEEAIRTAAEELPDLVLMDIVLQGPLDGIEAAAEIMSKLNIPVIYLTAYADDAILQRARVTGPFGYLIKPFDDRELLFTMEMALYRHKVDEEVRRTREQYRAMLEGLGAIPWEYDSTLRTFTYVGPQAEAILGYPPDEWKGLGFWEGLVHPDDRQAALMARLKCMESGMESNGSNSNEYRVVTASGEEKWIQDVVCVFKTAEGFTTLRGLMVDITRQKQAELERERLIDELQKALAKIKTLSGLLPICAWCKKIRDDKGYWTQVETYVKDHTEAEFTHGICPECHERLEAELEDYKKKE